MTEEKINYKEMLGLPELKWFWLTVLLLVISILIFALTNIPYKGVIVLICFILFIGQTVKQFIK